MKHAEKEKSMLELEMVAFSGNGILQPGTNAYKATFFSRDGWELWLDGSLGVIHVRKGPFVDSVHITQVRQFRLAQSPTFPGKVKAIDVGKVA
jgi:hypothetical protein